MKGFNGFGLQERDLNVELNRHLFVGGSDVPTILGINSYKSQFQLAKEKLGIEPNEFTGNEYTKFGNVLEPQIREYINKINDTNFIVQTFIDEDQAIRSNVDGIDHEHNLLLEIKTHGKNPKKQIYYVQMQLYMYQTGAEEGWLALYERPSNFDVEFDADRLEIEVVEKDPELIQKILDAIETFWIRCEYLKESPEMNEQEFMTLGTDMDRSIAKLNQLAPKIVEFKQMLKEYQQQEEALKDELYKKMTEGDIKKIETPLLVVTRVLPSKSNRFDSKSFKEEHPDLYQEYLTENERKGYVKLKEVNHD
ncbi:lambda-exonuclease family protein [Hutsoniella sourekii]|uniref:lambda-exonuclease family protein n=1 Tax=Hutsoniella sourekii TaxID=87650 RepID=UPI0004806346|nr:YqaJ viral recombinase family protein [Hutsoniella sourekii]